MTNDNNFPVMPALDLRQVIVRDEFMGGAQAAGVPAHDISGWSFVFGGTGTYVNGAVASKWGVVQFITGNVGGNVNSGFLGGGPGPIGEVNFGALTGWELTYVFQLNGTLINTNFFIGLVSPASIVVGGQGIYLRANSGSGDTNFMFCTVDGGGTTATDSGVGIDLLSHTIRIRSDVAGRIKFSLDNRAWVENSTNVLATALSPGFLIGTVAAVAVAFALDFFGLTVFPVTR